MRALGSSGLFLAGTLTLALISAPAAAEYPGSTQPGADQAPPGTITILRVVPPRNALISGAGPGEYVSTAPPSIVFEAFQGVGTPLSDAEAASVTGALSPVQGGNVVAKAIGGVLGSERMSGAATPERAEGGAASRVSGPIQAGVGSLSSILGSLGPGH
jgi:protein-disulfide isomerase